MKQFLLLISLTLILSSFKTIPEKIFDSKAYKELGSPDTLVVPEGYTAIGDGAFYWCRSLTSISIPNSVTSIGDGAFYGCNNLNPANISMGQNFIIENGILYDKDKTTILSSFPKYISDSITIPNTVTSIGESAFRWCTSLTSITIPNSVTAIGEYAFYRCRSLTSISIPNSVTSIGESAFSGCSSLTSISIPNSVKSIEGFTFYGCSSLTSITIPNSVTSIERWTFNGCSSLTSISIPNSVTSIGDDAFHGCNNLNPANISMGQNFIIENGILYDKDKTIICYGHPTRNDTYGNKIDVFHADRQIHIIK